MRVEGGRGDKRLFLSSSYLSSNACFPLVTASFREAIFSHESIRKIHIAHQAGVIFKLIKELEETRGIDSTN